MAGRASATTRLRSGSRISAFYGEQEVHDFALQPTNVQGQRAISTRAQDDTRDPCVWRHDQTSERRMAQRRKRIAATPAEMKAAAVDKFGPASLLKVRNVPVPRPGPREVLIALHAAGVGIWDAKIRDGEWAEGDIPFPMIPGTDGAGEIAEKGDRVRRFDIGDRVWSYQFESSKGGGFTAEYVVVDMDHVGHVPSRLSMLEAGAGAVTGLTALQGCDDHLRLRRGERVLIFGASGAVGTLAVQFASRYLGARVIAIASGQ